MNEEHVATLEHFIAETGSGPFVADDVLEEGIGFQLAGDIEGLAVWRDEVEKLYLYATIGAFPADHPQASRVPLQFNLFWASARSAFCALDPAGEQLLLCLALKLEEIDAETVRAAAASLVSSVRELRGALDALKDDATDEPEAGDEVFLSV